MNRNIPQWLKNVQENSWEIELLISGGAIFALFQLSDVFIDFYNTGSILGLGINLHFFLVTGIYALKTLTIGFITHLMFRSFWLALICINYVFPNGIKTVKHRKPFTSKFKENDDLQRLIYQLDRAAGLVMFCAIFLVVLLIGITITYFCLYIIPSLLFPFISNYEAIFHILLLFYLSDLILFGLFRKIPVFNYIIYPIFKLFDFFFLRKFYARPLQLYSSNISKKFAYFGFTFLILASTIFTYNSIYKIMHWPYFFDNRPHLYNLTDKSKPELIYSNYKDYLIGHNLPPNGPYISSKLIKSNFLEVYIPYHSDFSYNFPINESFDKNIIVKIDQQLSEVNWFKFNDYNRVYTGLTTLIDIKNLEPGKHVLTLSSKNKSYESQIVFWKDYPQKIPF
ncbi:hypothetical protein [Mesonia mobilis]|uniref:hypothetical protein n=3 Tax=Mesonia mobilis TaxID=369791 RepID=UPI0026EEA825|nr:hypothetical protein [Mesonia mobilis]